MSIAITREQRDVLWADIVIDLTAIGDIYLALDQADWAKARTLRARFEQDMRLLDDIGWARHDPGERFELTVPIDEIRRTLERLRQDAIGILSDQLAQTATEAALRSIRTHGAILAQLPGKCSPSPEG